MPLGMSQGICLNDPSGLQKLYAENQRRCCVRRFLTSIFWRSASGLKRWRQSTSHKWVPMHQPALRPSHESIVKDPHVLCISSQQYLAARVQESVGSCAGGVSKGPSARPRSVIRSNYSDVMRKQQRSCTASILSILQHLSAREAVRFTSATSACPRAHRITAIGGRTASLRKRSRCCSKMLVFVSW